MNYPEEGFIEGQKLIVIQICLQKDKIINDNNYRDYITEWIGGVKVAIGRAERILKGTLSE